MEKKYGKREYFILAIHIIFFFISSLLFLSVLRTEAIVLEESLLLPDDTNSRRDRNKHERERGKL